MSDETSFVPGPETRDAFRAALGCFGTGVTVVTTMSARGPLAMTANSFASVSLDPPLILWCPAKSSRRHDAFVAAERFAVHVMADDQYPLALHFARQGDDFDAIAWDASSDGPPLLQGALARFDCQHDAAHDGGDHTIVLGRVRQACYRPGLGLMFKQGRYGGFAGLP